MRAAPSTTRAAILHDWNNYRQQLVAGRESQTWAAALPNFGNDPLRICTEGR